MSSSIHRKRGRIMGVICIISSIVVPVLWLLAVAVTDPEFSMSDAEAVYDYTVRHTNLSEVQKQILSDAVVYAHGSSSIVRFLPFSLSALLLVSGLVHLTVVSRWQDENA